MTRYSRLILTAITLVGFGSPGFAQTNTTFTYQGELAESGSPATGAYDMGFSLWDAVSGGSQVGVTVNKLGQSVTDGLFFVELDFGADVYGGSQRWLEVVVDGNTLAPRQAITGSPYAIQTRGLYVDAGGNVGVGTTSPSQKLDVQGLLAVTDPGSSPLGSVIALGSPTGNIGMTMERGDGAGGQARRWDYLVASDGSLRFQDRTAGVDRLVIDTDGNLGIGTTSPQYPLEVFLPGTGRAVSAKASAGIGVEGIAEGDGGVGVYGASTSGNPNVANEGVSGFAVGPAGRGVLGTAGATSGTNYGVYGRSFSASGYDFFAGGIGQNYGSSSSRRWKRNVVPIDKPLDKLLRLSGVYFDWDTEHGGHHDVGLIAEEVGKVLPEIVNYEENGVDAIGMDYSKMTPLLVEGFNALRIEKDNQIATLQAENQALRKSGGCGAVGGAARINAERSTMTISSVLVIFDALCFQDSFVNDEPYACDTTTGIGVCDAFDFLCLQTRSWAGARRRNR